MFTSPDDVGMVVGFVRSVGLEPREVERRWDHLGGVIVDASLQPRTKYKAVVLPRVRKVISEWPDAVVLSGFRRRLESDDLAEFLGWRRTSRKLAVITGLTAALHAFEIETVHELAACYDSGDREQQMRHALRQVKGVGPKTVDYIAILTGSTGHVAVDMHVAGFVRDAGVHCRDYRVINALITQASVELGCSAGALDAAIWNYMSDPDRRRDNTIA
ncbi:hypothetical protein [Nocardia alba]|uniref:HhH-GPD domain-containing protein n=1 Tax=Nocardia alba TaxID=225051 RepID=A0A4R1FQ55_9NOCA|nr:hypothetical protein [Nocardia alba]TCJ95722.1 hypothetical protein DFR71_4639 [Nocardia alba]